MLLALVSNSSDISRNALWYMHIHVYVYYNIHYQKFMLYIYIVRALCDKRTECL